MIVTLMPRFARTVLVALLVLAALATGAGADPLGLIVAGDPAKQPVIETTLEPWLKEHGYEVKLFSKDPKVAAPLTDCFLLVGDQDCGEATVAKLKLKYTLFVMVQVQRDTKLNTDEVKLTGWLYGEKGTVTAQSQVCRACKNDTLGPTAEALAKSLFAVVGEGTGRVSIRSQPTGAAVRIDGDKVGSTPWEQGLLTGAHTVTIEMPGYRPKTMQIEIKKDDTVQLDVALEKGDPPPPPGSRKKWPLFVAGGGGLIAATGVVLLALDQDCKRSDDPADCDVPMSQETFRNTGTAGAVLIGAGAAVVATGVVLYLLSSPSAPASPTAWVDPGRGGGVGVVGRF